MAKNNKQKKDTPLNDFLVVFLLLNVIGGFFQAISSISKFGDSPLLALFELAGALLTIYGIYLILCLKKTGYFILVIPQAIAIIAALILAPFAVVNSFVVSCAASIVVVTLLMLLRKNGKSAFQLLWNGYDPDED